MVAAAAVIAAAAVVVFVFSVDLDLGFGMGFGRRRDSDVSVGAGGQQQRCAISPFGLDSDASVPLHCPRRFSRVGTTMCGVLQAAAVL